MNLSILLIEIALLSIVVRSTDSCSSFTRWKFIQVDVQINEFKIESNMTTEQIDIIREIESRSRNISNMIYIPKTTPIIVPPEAKFEKCEEYFAKLFCSNHGECIVIQYDSFNKTAQCICEEGYTGENCMEKAPNHHYITLNNNQQSTTDSPVFTTTDEIISTSTTASTTKTYSPESLREHAPCPSPWEENFCIHGECYILPHLSSIDFFCSCHRDYTGERCTEKITDFQYNTVTSSHSRERRDVSDKRRKYRINPRFRAVP